MVAAIAVPSPKYSVLPFRELNSSFVSASPLKTLPFPVKSDWRRSRNEVRLVVAAASSRGRFYFNFTGFPFPLGPFLNRRTIRYEVSAFSCGYLRVCALIDRLFGFRLLNSSCWIDFFCSGDRIRLSG